MPSTAMFSSTVQRLLNRVKVSPPVHALQQRRARARFLSARGFAHCWGQFDDFAAARASVPASAEFDTESLVESYVRDRTAQVFAYDYPVLWWLRDAFEAGATSVLDIGGSVGVHYHAYQRHLVYPPALVWTVSEVPTLVRRGRELAAEWGAPGLAFTDALDVATANADVWLSAGALQYVEGAARLGAWLATCRRPPAHVVVNKVPLYDGAGFVTSQNIGDGAFAPFYVYERRRFVADLASVGYRLIASWETPERQLRLLDAPGRAFGSFSGAYFRRESRG